MPIDFILQCIFCSCLLGFIFALISLVPHSFFSHVIHYIVDETLLIFWDILKAVLRNDQLSFDITDRSIKFIIFYMIISIGILGLPEISHYIYRKRKLHDLYIKEEIEKGNFEIL